MARLYAGDELWAELRRTARTSKRLEAAVAFVGRNPEAVLRWPKDTTLVADVSALSVKTGRTSARGVKKLQKTGAKVRSVADLHAKVYVFDKVAFIGSPNASEHSAHLEEAAVRLTKPAEVAAARAFVRRLWKDASPLPDNLLRQLVKMEPARLGGGGGGGGGARKPSRPTRRGGLADILKGRSLWLDAVSPAEIPTEVERARKRSASRLADDHEVEKAAEVEWTTLNRRTFKKVPEQDYVFVWWEPNPSGKRSPYGRLEGPLRCLGGFDHGRKYAEHRYARAEHGVRKRSVALDAAGIAVLSRLIPRARVASSREHAAHLHERIGGGPALRLKRDHTLALIKLVARLSRR